MSKSGTCKSLCSKCLSISPAGESQASFLTPSSAGDLQWKHEPQEGTRRSPRAGGVAGGLGNLLLLQQGSAAILSSTQSHRSLGRVSCHIFCFCSLLFVCLFSFVFHLSLLADYYGHYRDPVSTVDAWYTHRWVWRITTGMSLWVASMFELVVLLKLLSLKLPYKTESEWAHGRDANTPSPFSEYPTHGPG